MGIFLTYSDIASCSPTAGSAKTRGLLILMLFWGKCANSTNTKISDPTSTTPEQMASVSRNARAPSLFAMLESADGRCNNVLEGYHEFFRFRFGLNDTNVAGRRSPLAVMPLSRNNCDEVWYTRGPVEWSQQGDIKIRMSPDYLALHIEQKVSAETLCQATQSACQRLVSRARNCGYEHMQRAWNDFPQINHGAGDHERYRQFSSGRSMAFAELGFTQEEFPAGTAIGTPAGSPLAMTLLAAKQPCLMLENPRQASACHYPRQHGKHSPSFSRAALLPFDGCHPLLISGTASFVGHNCASPRQYHSAV
jgi:hypothetical protein